MYHQPDQMGQWPIPGPSQHGNHPYPPMRKRKAVDPDDAPPSKKRAVQPRVDDIQHHAQGLGQQALPFYPTTSPVAQTYYYPHTQQGLWQQPPPPVVAAQESAVKRGKRKAVELDDARLFHQNIIPINGSISRGSSSNIGESSSKTQEEAVAQVPCEASTSKKTL
ncbi:hypothetical protein CY34DRAFT_802069, partial [Suillus luteus UH-Slu-Lm8-n1]